MYYIYIYIGLGIIGSEGTCCIGTEFLHSLQTASKRSSTHAVFRVEA